MYKKIQSEYNRFLSSKDKSNKTIFMKTLAQNIGTSLSNLYEIIKDALIIVKAYNLEDITEFSASTSYQKRNSKSIESNSSKRKTATPFINLVIKEFRSKMNINSIDEIINDFIRNRPNEIEDMVTICTSTFYNYVEDNKIPGFSKYELPMKMKRKVWERKKGKTKGKGISIEQRPFAPEDRSIFGHWEGDLIVSGTEGEGAILTLVERMTRYQITIKVANRKTNTIYKAFHKIRKFYPDFEPKDVFKSITFDNGSEFSCWEKIMKYLENQVYFAHPYSSWERGSNENGNKLLGYFIPKNSDISKYTMDFIMNANELINNKIRKILGYKSSLEMFNNQLAKLAG